MVSKRKIQQVVANHIALRSEYLAFAQKALHSQDYSGAATMCHRAHQQQKIIDTLKGLL